MRSDNSLICGVAWLVYFLTAGPVHAAEPAGKTIMAKGTVEASDQLTNRALKRQSPVYQVDLISTGHNSSSQLRMTDGGLLSMHADTTLAIHSYEAAQSNRPAAVNMELLKGGLRTITGSLPQTDKSYQLNTPVASIGVRGTHYEAVLLEGDLYLAGWDGIIDINVTVPGVSHAFSLGPALPYRFAIVRANGDVELLLGTPPALTSGQSLAIPDRTEFDTRYAQTPDIAGMQDWLVIGTRLQNGKPLSVDAGGYDFFNNEQLTAGWALQGMDSISRSGTVNFNHLAGHSFSSSAGQLTDLSMSMQVDFDSAWIPSGQLSFTDPGGEWFAAFNGVFGERSLELFVNFASHGNSLAQGSIKALLIDDARAVLGNLSFTELNNPSTRLDGGFLLTEQP